MLIQVNNLSYAYGDRELLNNISFVMEDRDKIALVGLNGSGKSTLLRLIATRDPAITYAKDLTISYLPQNPVFEENLSVMTQAQQLCPDAKDFEVKSTLTRFGLMDHNQRIAQLSGGQKRRLSLACTLLKDCDLLILDEPTNHLDTQMIEYLEKYLIKRNKGLLMVTHDRYFLERVTNHIYDLSNGALEMYEGNYASYLEEKAQRLKTAKALQHKREQFLKQELAWIRAGVQARTTKSKSRIQRFEALNAVPQIKETDTVSMISTASRLGKKTIQLDHVSYRYEGDMLFEDFSFLFKRFERIGILGENGTGKSTLLDIIAGRLDDYQGTIDYGETIKIGYYRQESEPVDASKRVIDYIRDTADVLITSEGPLTARTMCERFLFDSKAQYTKINRLSGGERRRLYLLKVLMTNPNVLLLDEPTNDLDIETLTILEDYLDNFAGIVIVVSHDRYFLDRIVDRLWVLKDGKITVHNGGYSINIDTTAAKEEKESKKEDYRKEKQSRRDRKLTYREQKEMDETAAMIEDIEAQIKDIDEKMGTPLSFDDMAALSAQREALEETLELKNERFLELLEIAEGS